MPEFEIDPLTGRMIPMSAGEGGQYGPPRRGYAPTGFGPPGSLQGRFLPDGMRPDAIRAAPVDPVTQEPLQTPSVQAAPWDPMYPQDQTGGQAPAMWPSDQTGTRVPPPEEPPVALQAPGPAPINPATPPPAVETPPALGAATAPTAPPPAPAAGALSGPTAPAQAAPPVANPTAALSTPVQPTAEPNAPDPFSVEAFRSRLEPRESGGNPGITNREGYTGLHQFGAPRLSDLGVYTPGPNENVRQGWSGQGANRWTGTFSIPGHEGVRTVDDFRRNPEAQRAVFGAHVADIDRAIDTTPGASAYDRNGLRGVAHLGGNGGMSRYVATNGQSDPADSNGTRLSNYYRTFAGSDAPPSAGRGAAPTPAPAMVAKPAFGDPDATAAQERPAATAEEHARRGPPAGMSAQAWFALSAGLFGGRDMMDGLGRGLTGMNAQTRLDQDQATAAGVRQDNRADRREQRLDRNAQYAESNAINRARLGVQQQRATAASAPAARAMRGQPLTMTDPATSESLTRITFNDGGVETRDSGGNLVTNQDRLRTLIARQDTGDVARAGAQGRADVEQLGEMREASAGVRDSAEAASNLRTVVANNPNLTGASARSQVTRAVATALGIPVDGRSPQDIDEAFRGFARLEAGQIRQMAPLMKPFSNMDMVQIVRVLPTMNSSPENLLAGLDVFDRTHRRALARVEAVNAAQAGPEGASIARTPGGWNRYISEFDTRWDRENGSRPPAPRVPATNERSPNGPGYQSRTQSGVGFTLN